MHKILLFFSLLLVFSVAHGQDVDTKIAIEEGVSLHDKGDYDGAIKKFDAVLVKEPNNFVALFEKANSLTYVKKFGECVNICKRLIKDFSYESDIKQVYVMYGSAEDYRDNNEEAIRIYDEGIKKFPGYYLLYFNKGVTLQRQDKLPDAYNNYQLAIKNNHYHPGSYLRIAELLQTRNRIPAYLALVMQIISDPEDPRAKAAFDKLQEITYANVKKGEKNQVNITMNPPLPNDAKIPDNFRSQELMLSLSSALDLDSANQKKTPLENFKRKFELLVGMLSENKEQRKGFFWENIVPFFTALDKAGYSDVTCRLVLSTQNDERNAAWVKTHQDKVNQFYKWLNVYKWPQ